MKTIFSALAFLMMISPAMAQDSGRSLPFDQTLIGLDGKPLMDATDAAGKPKEPTPITLGIVAQKALIGPLLEDTDDPRMGRAGATAELKFNRAELVHKIRENPKALLKIDEISDIKARIGRAYGSEIVWSAYNLIEPRADAAKK